jgi:membrane protein implicated in regulation of membrane protease activity
MFFDAQLSPATLWWIATTLVVAAELHTGTFYLLMVALGLACGALAAHAQLSLSLQMSIAALISSGATILWHRHQNKKPKQLPAQQNADVHLDIGQRVQVLSWQPQGTTTVQHRGTTWQAQLSRGTTAQTGEHIIQALQGNQLILIHADAQSTPH